MYILFFWNLIFLKICNHFDEGKGYYESLKLFRRFQASHCICVIAKIWTGRCIVWHMQRCIGQQTDMEISPVVVIGRKPVATTSEGRWSNWINFGNKKPPRASNDNCSASHFHLCYRVDEWAFKLNFDVWLYQIEE